MTPWQSDAEYHPNTEDDANTYPETDADDNTEDPKSAGGGRGRGAFSGAAVGQSQMVPVC
jgi:hypothetical protein